MIGPVASTIRRRVDTAGVKGLLFTWPGTERPPTRNEYKNWRGRYFGPIARGRGLGLDADDPYSLRHVYATVRIAAGHPVAYINASMGSSLSATTYNTIQHELEAMGKAGSYDIDGEIRIAREAALTELEERLAAVDLELPAEYRKRFLGGVAEAEEEDLSLKLAVVAEVQERLASVGLQLPDEYRRRLLLSVEAAGEGQAA